MGTTMLLKNYMYLLSIIGVTDLDINLSQRKQNNWTHWAIQSQSDEQDKENDRPEHGAC